MKWLFLPAALSWLSLSVLCGCSNQAADLSSPQSDSAVAADYRPAADDRTAIAMKIANSSPTPETAAETPGNDKEFNYMQFVSEFPLFEKFKSQLATGGNAGFYTLHLHHAQEPDLTPFANSGDEVYRLITIDSGATNSRILRLEKSKGQVTLTAKRLEAHAIFSGEKGILSENTSQRLTDKKWLEFTTLLQQANFWNLPTANPTTGLDGTFYLVEGATPTKKHIVSRWSDAPANYRQLFKYLESAASAAERLSAPDPPVLPDGM